MKPLIVAPITTGGKLYMGRVHVAAHFEGQKAEGEIKLREPLPDSFDSSAALDALLQADAEAIAQVLHATLPHGTWVRLVAVIAAQWAADQDGLISAANWYPGVSQHKEPTDDDPR